MSYSHQILLAEDDDQYAFLTQLALEQAGIEGAPIVLPTEEEVIAYMAGERQYADRETYPIPAVLILATRLPLMANFKALRWVRQHKKFDHVRILVLSGVEYNRERAVARELGADCYHGKPSDFEDLVAIAQSVRQRWLDPHPDQAAA